MSEKIDVVACLNICLDGLAPFEGAWKALLDARPEIRVANITKIDEEKVDFFGRPVWYVPTPDYTTARYVRHPGDAYPGDEKTLATIRFADGVYVDIVQFTKHNLYGDSVKCINRTQSWSAWVSFCEKWLADAGIERWETGVVGRRILRAHLKNSETEYAGLVELDPSEITHLGQQIKVPKTLFQDYPTKIHIRGTPDVDFVEVPAACFVRNDEGKLYLRRIVFYAKRAYEVVNAKKTTQHSVVMTFGSLGGLIEGTKKSTEQFPSSNAHA